MAPWGFSFHFCDNIDFQLQEKPAVHLKKKKKKVFQGLDPIKKQKKQNRENGLSFQGDRNMGWKLSNKSQIEKDPIRRKPWQKKKRTFCILWQRDFNRARMSALGQQVTQVLAPPCPTPGRGISQVGHTTAVRGLLPLLPSQCFVIGHGSSHIHLFLGANNPVVNGHQPQT